MEGYKWFRNKHVYPVIIHKILCIIGLHNGIISTTEETHGEITTYWCRQCDYKYHVNGKRQNTCPDGEVIK